MSSNICQQLCVNELLLEDEFQDDVIRRWNLLIEMFDTMSCNMAVLTPIKSEMTCW